MADFNPIRDEKKQLTLEEFTEIATSELDKYQKEFAGSNEFHNTSHTWSEWFSAFHRYMSW